MTRCGAILIFLLLSTPALAQIENNKVDVSGGYNISRNDGVWANGWFGDVGFRFYRSLYLVGATGGSYFSDSLDVSGTTYDFRASGHFVGGGARLFIRKHNVVSPFVEAIAGVQHNNATVSVAFSPVSEPVSVNDFGLAIGGGSDFRISRLLSVRLRPAYYLVRLESDFDSAFGFDAGLVLHFGH